MFAHCKVESEVNENHALHAQGGGGGAELAARASANHRLSSNITNSLLFASAGWVLSSHKSAPFFFSNKLIPHHGRVSHHPIKGGREFRNGVECS